MHWLGLEFQATYCQGWPTIKIYIDNDLYQDFEFLSDSAKIDVPLDLLPGSHELSIELYGKTNLNTKVENDIILQDQLVALKSMSIDNVILPDVVLYQGIYETKDNKHPKILTWGKNGKYNLQFESPIINWVLDLKLQALENQNWEWSSFNQTKRQLLINDLDTLEKLLVDASK